MTSNSSNCFLQLHQPGKPFVLANAWDTGSARMLVAMGAKAIATSSAAHAFVLGKKDLGHVTRDEALQHASELAAAVAVPVSGDFENGYGHSPEAVARTIEIAIQQGIAGACIEDIAAPSTEAYEFELAITRVEAAVDAAQRASSEFVLTARADGVMHGAYGLDEAIRRIREFERVGAQVLYVPVPGTIDDQAAICRAVQSPVNALAAGRLANCTLADFANAGVARVSLGSSLARSTHRVLHDCAKAIFEEGDFAPLSRSISGAKVEELVERGSP